VGRNAVTRKSSFGRVQTHMSYFLVSRPKFTGLFSPNAGKIILDHVFPILDILTHSRNIHNQSVKLYKIAPNLACFWTHIFGSGSPGFGTCIIKHTPILIMWQFQGDRLSSSQIQWKNK